MTVRIPAKNVDVVRTLFPDVIHWKTATSKINTAMQTDTTFISYNECHVNCILGRKKGGKVSAKSLKVNVESK